MELNESSHRRLRRLQALSGVIPVGLYLVAHFLFNAVAIAGRDAFNDWAATVDRLPGVRIFEVVAIGIPILAHAVLGVLLGNTAPAGERGDVYPRPWLRPLQRATGGFLVFYVIFHVWGTRLSPEVLKGERDLFGVMHRHLEHPGTLALHLLGVVAASAHLGLGLVGLRGYARRDPAPLASRDQRLAWAVFVAMSLIGLNALLAFVTPHARWLEPRDATASVGSR